MTLTSDKIDIRLIEYLAKRYVVEVSLKDKKIVYKLKDKRHALEQ